MLRRKINADAPVCEIRLALPWPVAARRDVAPAPTAGAARAARPARRGLHARQIGLGLQLRVGANPAAAVVQMFMDFVSGQKRDVPDPYYGDDGDFEAVYQMLSQGCDRLLSILFGR